jgi:type II secretory pathway component GspD/PulD (secretin)
MKHVTGFLTATIAVILTSTAAFAQSAPAAGTIACSDTPYAKQCADLLPQQTIYLKNINQQNDANEIVTAVRNTLPPDAKIYLVANQNAILVRATAGEIVLAQKIINDLDHPKKNYRLTYTVTEMDGGKQIGTQHYAMILASGQATSLKLGNKVPVATGSYSAGGVGVGVQTQFTYIDVGLNIDATLTAMGDGAILKSSVEQSSVAPVKADVGGTQQPIVRQASLRGESFLAPGKSQPLGSLDIPGSTSHLQIEVLMEPLP